jgi:hypothetical protein
MSNPPSLAYNYFLTQGGAGGYMKTVTYTSKYQPSSIIEEIIHSNKNTHLVKDRTGSGASFGLLSLRKEKILFVSPTVPLVKDKEEEYEAGLFPGTNIQFLYEKSKDKIKDVVPKLEGHIVMGTIDQITKLNAEEYIDAGYSLVFDELHVIINSSIFRDKCNYDFRKLANAFKKVNRCHTITATPLYVYPKFIQDFDVIKLENPEYVVERELQYIDDVNILSGLIEKGLSEQKETVIFSNSVRYINKICAEIEKKELKNVTQLIVGSSIKINNEALFTHLKEPKENALIYICSSAAMEGISLKIGDSSDVFIHNCVETDFGLYSVQQIVQALGRCRDGYNFACMCFDSKPKDSKNKKKEEEREKSEIERVAIKNIKISKSIVKNNEKLEKELKKYNYILKECVYEKYTKEFDKVKNDLERMCHCLLELDEDEFYSDLYSVKENAHINREFYGFSSTIVFAFLVTDILRFHCIPVSIFKPLFRDLEKRQFKDQLRRFRVFLIEYRYLHSRKTNKVRSEVKSKELDAIMNSFDLPVESELCLEDIKELKLDTKSIYSDVSGMSNNELGKKCVKNEQNFAAHIHPNIIENIPEKGCKSLNTKNIKNEAIVKKDTICSNTNILKKLDSIRNKDESRHRCIEDFEYFYCFNYPTKQDITKIKKNLEERYKEKGFSASHILSCLKIKHQTLLRELRTAENKQCKLTDASKLAKNTIRIESLKENVLNIEKHIKGLQNAKKEEKTQYTQTEMKYNVKPEEVIKKITAIEKNNLKKLAAQYIRNFNSGYIDSRNREYSAVTELKLHTIQTVAPYMLIEYDIVQAFPTFVNAIVDADINVYENIMKNRKCTRDKAKELYNTFLNSDILQIKFKDQFDFFNAICEYTEEQTIEIMEMNSKKGQAYDIFSQIEKKSIEKIKVELNEKYPELKKPRRHDAIVVFGNFQTHKKEVQENIQIEIKEGDIEINVKFKAEFF